MVVFGDYDVDGVTATALMVEALQTLGIRAHRYIPNRFEEGYGLNTDAIKLLADSGVTLILTVDCGIRSVAEADFAASQGVDLIISDHHHPGPELPARWRSFAPNGRLTRTHTRIWRGLGLHIKSPKRSLTGER